MNKKKIALLCCGDESYFSTPPYAPIVALTSFRKNFGDEVDYFCVGRFSDERTLRLIEHNELRPLNVDFSSVFNREHKSLWGNFPPEGFYIGKIPSLFLERSYDYCVVTDGDVYSNKRFDIEGLIEDADLSGVRQHPDYQINTGVLFFNNKRCVEKNFFKEFVRLYQTATYWSEQPLVNDLVDTHGFLFRELDITYNFTLRAKHLIEKSENREQILEAKSDDVKIAHFLRGKPWRDLRNTHFDYPIRNYFAQLYQHVNIKTLP